MLTEGLSTPEKESEQAGRRASKIVLDTLEEYNRRVEPGLRMSLSPAAALYGAGGGLDSLGLLDLVTLLETNLEQELGRRVALLEESSGTDGAAFRTVESLTAAVRSLVEPVRP